MASVGSKRFNAQDKLVTLMNGDLAGLRPGGSTAYAILACNWDKDFLRLTESRNVRWQYGFPPRQLVAQPDSDETPEESEDEEDCLDCLSSLLAGGLHSSLFQRLTIFTVEIVTKVSS